MVNTPVMLGWYKMSFPQARCYLRLTLQAFRMVLLPDDVRGVSDSNENEAKDVRGDNSESIH